MEPSFIRNTLMGLFSAIILGSFTMLLVLICIRWCLCNFCAAFFVRSHHYDDRHHALRIGIYDREGLTAVIDHRPPSMDCNTTDKSGLPTYEEAVRNMNRGKSDGKGPEIVIDPIKLL